MRPTPKRIVIVFIIYILLMIRVCSVCATFAPTVHSAMINKEYKEQGLVETEIKDVTVYVAEQEVTELPPLTQSLGKYELTGYCACMKCCGKTNGITSTGAKATANHTIAVDPRDIPYGTKVMINGIEYEAQDCGGAIKGKRIDIYFDTHEEALQFGRQKNVEVFLVIE